MANITCFAQSNFGGYQFNYSTDQPDITEEFPKGVGSANVQGGVVTVYQQINYKGVAAQLSAGKYPDSTKFPPGGFKSLKVE